MIAARKPALTSRSGAVPHSVASETVNKRGQLPKGVLAAHSPLRSPPWAAAPSGRRIGLERRTASCADLSADRRYARERLPHPGDGAGGRLHLRHVRHRRRLPDDPAVDLRRHLARRSSWPASPRISPPPCSPAPSPIGAGAPSTSPLGADAAGGRHHRHHIGVWLFTMLRAVDQLDLMIGLAYVTLLSVVGVVMMIESVRAVLRARHGQPADLRRPGSHAWFHGLPLKLRFKRSQIYVSAIPVWAIGAIIGFIGAILGIGGGFMLVPMLIYLLRVPTATVIGTSIDPDAGDHGRGDHPARDDQSPGRCAAGADPDDRRRDRRPVRRARRPEASAANGCGCCSACWCCWSASALPYDLVVTPADPYSIRLIRTAMTMRRTGAHARDRAGGRRRAAGRGRAAGGVAVEPPGAGHLELRRRGPGAVRHGRARPGTASAARELRHGGDGDRPAQELPHPAQGAACSASGSTPTCANSCACRPISRC